MSSINIAIIVAFIAIACSAAVNAEPEAADLVFTDDFEGGLSDTWKPYDNWAEPEFGLVQKSPIAAGKALRVAFDDTSTVSHFDKGALLMLPEPIPWLRIDFISARYHIDSEVANMRIFCHCDKGGWWDYTTTDVAVGEPASISARRNQFRLAWTDDPEKPAPDKTGNILAVYFSVHNAEPVNTGEWFVLHLDDIRIGTWLLPVPQPIDLSAPRLTCWPIAACDTAPDPDDPATMSRCAAIPCGEFTIWAGVTDGTVHLAGAGPGSVDVSVNRRPLETAWTTAEIGSTFSASLPGSALGADGSRSLHIACGDAEWSGRYKIVRALQPHEALALTLRTDPARCEPVEDAFTWGKPVHLTLQLPVAWTKARTRGSVSADSGKHWQLNQVARRSRPGFEAITLSTNPDVAGPPAGHHRASFQFSTTSGTLRAFYPLHVSELDRTALADEADDARRRTRQLADRAQAGNGEPWWARQPLATTPAVRHQTRIEPSEWSQIPDPVTWDDLGGRFRGGAQCGIDEQSLETYFDHYDFGRVIKPHLGYFLRDGWREKLQMVADRDLIVTSVWGYVPNTPWNGGFGHVEIPIDQHNAILDILGRRFLGYEMGEQDGRYVGSYAPKYSPATRREAKRLFDNWHQDIIDNFHGHMVALASLNYLHDYARLGLRMLGIEASQGLPSDIMEWAFIRGASKQWGALTWNCISIFNRWGYKSYTSTGDNHGPDKGPSVDLLRRLWYVTYMYGSAINMFESGYFTDQKDDAGFPRLSPVGKCHVDAVQWAREHADRGVQYTPVAVMLDRDSGWTPPRHLYTGKRHLVWGNIPYGRADHATDAFFRRIWPQYQDCSYYRDERGYLTATPFGDIFDVILSDAPSRCLDRYQTLIVLGLPGTPTDALCPRLRKFVAAGGELICDYSLARQLGPEITGVEVTDDRRAAQFSVLLPGGQLLEEDPYTYQVAKPRGAKALALSDRGDGILFSHRSGDGLVITSMALNYVSAETQDPQPDIDVPLKHKLLRAFMHTIRPYLHSLNLIHVEGGPIQYLCNVSEDPNRLIITLANNDHEPKNITVTSRIGEFTARTPWLGDAQLRNGSIHAKLPPLDLAIFEVRLAQPAATSPASPTQR